MIYQSLIQAGLPAASASAFQNAVGQCRAPLTHRGPVQFDYTRPEMRLITPEAARFQFPGLALDAPQSFPVKPNMPPPPPFDPPEIPPEPPPECPDCEPEVPPGEPVWPPPWWPPNRPPPPRPPQPPRGCTSIQAGAYLDNAGSCGVYLKTRGGGRHATLGGDVIEGIQFKGEKKDEFYIEVREYSTETRFLVKSPKLEDVEFLKSVSVGPDRITFEIWSAKMLKAEFKETKHIELTECEQ